MNKGGYILPDVGSNPGQSRDEGGVTLRPTALEGPVVRSEDLFGGGREIVILHRGMRYRLLQTRQGKLILNK